MKFKKVVAVAIFFLALSPPVMAETGEFYYSIDALSWTYNQPPNAASSTGIRGVIGQDFNKTFAWEFHAGLGGSGNGGSLGTVSLDSVVGAYLRMNMPVGKGDIHGLVGFGEATASNTVSRTRDAGLSWGVGAQYPLTDRLSLRADYMQYVVSTNWDLKGLALGISFSM